jgi:hypothetical protein
MTAIAEVWPQVTFLQLHTPARSDPATPPRISRQQFAGASATELAGSFFSGMLEALPKTATLYDGGELYLYRTQEDFANSSTWRREETRKAPFVGEVARRLWDRVKISFGLFNLTWKDVPMNEQVMETTLTHALRHADNGLVWIYVEKEDWIKNRMQESWRKAIEGAISRAKAAK